jgi:hypothetical protein
MKLAEILQQHHQSVKLYSDLKPSLSKGIAYILFLTAPLAAEIYVIMQLGLDVIVWLLLPAIPACLADAIAITRKMELNVAVWD